MHEDQSSFSPFSYFHSSFLSFRSPFFIVTIVVLRHTIADKWLPIKIALRKKKRSNYSYNSTLFWTFEDKVCVHNTIQKDAHDPSVNFYEMQSNYLATSFSFQTQLKVESHNKGSNINSS